MAVKQLGKKGMFLTFIAISLIAALIMIFTPPDITLSGDMQATRTRVLNVNNYVLDLENVYLERTLQATGRKTIISLIEYMEAETIRTGTEVFLTDFEANFEEVLLDGTIGGVDIDTYYTGDIMTGNTYNDWLDRVKTTAKNTFNVDTVYGVSDIKVYQITPWFVSVDANLSFNVSSETASWNRTAVIKTEISVENFEDPYYLVKTSGGYKNIINKSGTKFDEWDVEKVKDFIRNGNYTHFENSNAPSFLMRFTNDISASGCCGIESLVNPNNPAVSDKDVSYAGYLYWSSVENCASPPYTLVSVNEINTEFPNFKFDVNHLAKYKLSADEQICPPPE